MFVRIVALASAVLLAGCAYVAVGSLPEVNTPGPKIHSDLEVKAGTLLERVFDSKQGFGRRRGA